MWWFISDGEDAELSINSVVLETTELIDSGKEMYCLITSFRVNKLFSINWLTLDNVPRFVFVCVLRFYCFKGTSGLVCYTAYIHNIKL